MGLFAKIFLTITHKLPNKKSDERSNFIFYKIIECSEDYEGYVLQCINTNATFQAKINDLVFDIDLLYGLHPIQSCYIGIEYSKYIKMKKNFSKSKNLQKQNLCEHSTCRYGAYKLMYQNRKGNLCFISKKNKEEYIMDPRDIALSEDLISEFDAAQAFYIGLSAGLKMNNVVAKDFIKTPTLISPPHLHIVR